MVDQKRRKQQARILRIFRKVHRYTGIFLFVFFFIVAVSGLILGWKKNSNDLIMPSTQKGTTTNVKGWLSLDSLQKTAFSAVGSKVNLTPILDKIDVRPDKGILKFIFVEKQWEVQLDGKTGEVLSIGRRHADFFENLHDGSVVDDWLSLGGYFKVFYTTIMGIALITFAITGFWLWYGPKRLRAART